MNFWTELLIISVAGGIVAIDTTASWQVMISQPIVACSLIGLSFGEPELGLLIGILLELPWLIEIPTGGSHISEGNIGSLVTAGLTIHLVHHQIDSVNIALICSILWGLWISWLGGKLVHSMRKTNVMFSYRADKAANTANLKKITLLNMGGVGHAYFLGFFLAGISFTLGTLIIGKLAALIPTYFDKAFGYGKIGILALGTGILLSMFLSRENFKYFVIGIITAFVLFFII